MLCRCVILKMTDVDRERVCDSERRREKYFLQRQFNLSILDPTKVSVFT